MRTSGDKERNPVLSGLLAGLSLLAAIQGSAAQNPSG
jgi:hypothetical protein